MAWSESLLLIPLSNLDMQTFHCLYHGSILLLEYSEYQGRYIIQVVFFSWNYNRSRLTPSFLYCVTTVNITTMHPRLLTLGLGGLQLIQAAAVPSHLDRRAGSNPGLPHDEKTTEFCTWWLDYNEAMPCNNILQGNQITIQQFKRWVSLPTHFHYLCQS
jgi:hypothetical protein